MTSADIIAKYWTSPAFKAKFDESKRTLAGKRNQVEPQSVVTYHRGGVKVKAYFLILNAEMFKHMFNGALMREVPGLNIVKYPSETGVEEDVVIVRDPSRPYRYASVSQQEGHRLQTYHLHEHRAVYEGHGKDLFASGDFNTMTK